MGLAWQQGPLAPGAIGRFLVPGPLPGRLLYAEPLRRRMRVRFGEVWAADSEDVVLPTSDPGDRLPPAARRLTPAGVLVPSDSKGENMPANHLDVVLVHGAWADGSSWSKVIGPLKGAGLTVVAAPLPLTSLADDIAAVERVLERLDGPVVLAGHAYAGAVIAETRDPKVASLVYIAGLAPEEGETVSDVFYHDQPHPKAPELKPDSHGLVWLPENAFADAFAQNASPQEQAILAAVQRPIDVACISVPVGRPRWKDGPSWVLVAENDRMINPETQLFQAERMGAHVCTRPVDHTPLVTAPEDVVGIILDAARDVAAAT